MKRNEFKNILKKHTNQLAFEYINEKRGKKGSEVNHVSLRLADYLAPNNSGLSILEKQEMFSVINRMVQISYNFRQNDEIDVCQCGQKETMEHIYICKLLNNEEPIEPYQKIFTGNIGEQVTVFKRFQMNMKEREQLLQKLIV